MDDLIGHPVTYRVAVGPRGDAPHTDGQSMLT
jgi:hypothetical protein